MKTLDITIDFETCALCPTAAPLSVAAVAWDRYDETDPFINASDFFSPIDLRSAFVDGFTIDPKTAEWWSKQSEVAKAQVTGMPENGMPLCDVKHVIGNLLTYIAVQASENEADEVCLWSQGSDFDIAILRNICEKYGMTIPVKYTNFRDHRTFFLEGARIICDATDTEFDAKKAYSLVEEYTDYVGVPHDPIYDCRKSIYSTWQMMKHLRTIKKH